MMKRMMIQADEALLGRARRRAAERGISVAQVVREALEREVGDVDQRPRLTSIGIASSTAGDLSARAAEDEYEPPPSRS